MAETLIPEGRGKAEAMRTYLARGGGLTKMGRYRSGPMKDQTQAQAEVMFENHWQTVGDGVKEKYATRANNVLAPSERLINGLTPGKAQVQEVSTPARPSAVAPPATAAPVIPGMKPSPVTSPPTDRPQFARRGGTSVLGIAGRIASGASPSAKPVAPAPTPAPIMPTTPLAQRELANRKAAVDATPTGQPVVANPAPGINRLTGLPFGYQPGDSQAPGSPAIDPTLAAQSVKRQEVATSKAAMAPQAKPLIPGIAPMPRGPASQPTPTGSALDDPNNAFSKEAYARTAAAEAQGVKRQEELSKAVNVDDPKKFFTGRTLPLDQLVKNQKLRGIGTPARQ